MDDAEAPPALLAGQVTSKDPEDGLQAVVALRLLLAELGRARQEVIRLAGEAGVAATGGRLANEALSSIGIDVAEIQRRADDTFGPGVFRFPRPAFTVQAKRVLQQSLRESLELGDEQI